MIEKARSVVDFEERRKMYRQISKTVYDNYEEAWLYYSMWIMAVKKNVMGYNPEMYDQGRDNYIDTHLLWFKDGRR